MRMPVIGVVFLFGLALSQPALGAVVEVEVTIKSVNPQSRGITVVYNNGTTAKSIDLDVSRKAEIAVNGTSGTLDSLRPGQKAKVAFEKELQVVTKIDATGSGTAPGREIYRVTLQLSEFGDGKFRIEKTSEPPADEFQGTPFKLSRWPHTKATKGQDGMFRLVHDFSDPDDLNLLAFQKDNLTIDKASGLAVFTPGPLPEGFQCDVEPTGSTPRNSVFRLPCSVTLLNTAGNTLHFMCPASSLECCNAASGLRILVSTVPSMLTSIGLSAATEENALGQRSAT